MGFKPQVKVAGNGDKWAHNALVFATETEAINNAHDLMMRWYAVTDYGAVEVEAEATHTYHGAVLGYVGKENA